MPRKLSSVLLAAVLLNYLAQIPYYLHQYYIPHHLSPSAPGTILLGLTLLWFLTGYYLFMSRSKYGWSLLITFLVTQVLFYGHAIALGIAGGGIVAQLRTSGLFLLVIFGIGYLNFIVAACAVYWMLKHRDRHGRATGDT